MDANDLIYATIDDGLITLVTSTLEGHSNYKTIEDLQSNLDPRTVLARPPLLPGQHQSDQRSHALVQVVLPAPDGRQEAHRDPRQPRPDEEIALVIETIDRRGTAYDL